MFSLVSFGLIAPFLFGSIPFGLLITQSAGLGDIRNIGSGNVGATNVLRTGKKGLALATLLCDAGKGATAVILARLMAPDDLWVPLAAALFAVLGHMFSPWIGFKGGKGVATSIGVILATAWPVGVLAILIWVFMAWKFRYSSLAALSAAAATPFLALLFAPWQTAVVFIGIAGLVAWRHEGNIKRLLAGEESKISFGAKS
jgi:glycerol-3-phosphate acyltransferase PlsY